MEYVRCFSVAVIRYAVISMFSFFSSGHALAELVKLETETGFDSVYLLENSATSEITVGLMVLAGEVDVTGPEGLSHYLEHLMFWHADNIDDQQLHSRGGNASVNGFITNYYNTGERSELDDMFKFIRKLFTLPTLDQGFMVRERSVVAREYDLGVSENPDYRIYTSIRRKLYNNSPVSRSVIGTPQSISALTQAQAFRFHKKYYHPANAVLYISGDIRKQEAEKLVNSEFGSLEPGVRHVGSWRSESIKKVADFTEEFTDSQVGYKRLLYLTLSNWPAKSGSSNPGSNRIHRWYTKRLLAAVLDSALDGGIARPLRMDNFVLRSFSVDLVSFLEDQFELMLFAEPDKGVSLEQASKSISDTLNELASKSVPAKTLERVRARMLQTERRTANSRDHTFYLLAEQLSSGLTPVTSSEHLEYIKNVTLEDVNLLLRALATPERRAIAFIKPSGN